MAQRTLHRLQVELVVALWGRVVAYRRVRDHEGGHVGGGWNDVLGALTELQVEELAERLGWLNLFDPWVPSLRYSLDLARCEHRQLAAMLLNLAMGEQEAGLARERATMTAAELTANAADGVTHATAWLSPTLDGRP